MAAGAAAATLTNTAVALGVSPTPAPFVAWPSYAVANQGGLLVATAALCLGGLVSLAKGAQSDARRNAVGLLSEAAFGGLFALGLTYSGMVRPAKVMGPAAVGEGVAVWELGVEFMSVCITRTSLPFDISNSPTPQKLKKQVAAFLSPLSSSWDATLMFVMGGALLVALPVFQSVKRSTDPSNKPLCGECYSQPASTNIDWRLAAGGVLFGAGWGVSGICPG
jgi:uncharacterized membrane protein YedE/YeeE